MGESGSQNVPQVTQPSPQQHGVRNPMTWLAMLIYSGMFVAQVVVLRSTRADAKAQDSEEMPRGLWCSGVLTTIAAYMILYLFELLFNGALLCSELPIQMFRTGTILLCSV